MELIESLRQIPFFQQLTKEERALILPFLQLESFDQGSWIIREGDIRKEAIVIISGVAEVIKEEKEMQDFIRLGTLTSGDWAGEMAYLENTPRSSSVRAVEKTEVILVEIKKIAQDPNCRSVYMKLLQVLSKQVSERLRKMDESWIVSIKNKINLLSLRDEEGNMIIYLFSIMVVYLNIGKIIGLNVTRYATTANSWLFSFITVLLGAPALLMIWRSKHPWEFYGLTLKNWKEHAVKGLLFSLPILGLLILIKWYLVHSTSTNHRIPVFFFIAPGRGPLNYFTHLLLFIVMTLFIEVITRGFLQTTLKTFYESKNKVFLSILNSNLIINIFYSVGDFRAALYLFFLGIFLGYLFEKQKSIIGCWVSHAFLSGFTYFVLGFDYLNNF